MLSRVRMMILKRRLVYSHLMKFKLKPWPKKSWEPIRDLVAMHSRDTWTPTGLKPGDISMLTRPDLFQPALPHNS